MRPASAVGETDGMLLRVATPGDELAVAEVHVRSWQSAYRGLMPNTFLDALRPEDRAARYAFAAQGADQPVTVVAVEDARVLGFASVGPARDADRPADGELYALYVDPERVSHGIGRALLADARERLARRGHPAANLWVLEGNARAQHFYQTDGWVPDGARRVEDVYGITSEVVRFHRALP